MLTYILPLLSHEDYIKRYFPQTPTLVQGLVTVNTTSGGRVVISTLVPDLLRARGEHQGSDCIVLVAVNQQALYGTSADKASISLNNYYRQWRSQRPLVQGQCGDFDGNKNNDQQWQARRDIYMYIPACIDFFGLSLFLGVLVVNIVVFMFIINWKLHIDPFVSCHIH